MMKQYANVCWRAAMAALSVSSAVMSLAEDVPVPLTGFVPNVSEPRKQTRWDE